MTTTTCTHPCTEMNDQPPSLRWPKFNVWHGLARLGTWARGADALQNMDLRHLQDIGAPDWLQQRAASRKAVEDYEYIKATSRQNY